MNRQELLKVSIVTDGRVLQVRIIRLGSTTDAAHVNKSKSKDYYVESNGFGANIFFTRSASIPTLTTRGLVFLRE